MTATAARSPRKAKGRGGERREEILQAALRLFVEKGADQVSTRQIAQEVGISQPTLYAYFPTKDDIGRELHDRAFALLAEHLAARNQRGRVDSVEDVAAMLRVYIDFGLENPDMYRIAFMTVQPRIWTSSEPVSMTPATQSTFGVLAALIADLHARGRMVDAPSETLAQCTWAGLHGLVSLLIAKPRFPWTEREHLIRTHVQLLARGILSEA